MKKSKQKLCYVVGHDDFPNAYVIADNWELATIKAAEYWDVPWKKVAAECYLVKCHVALQNICERCGKRYFGELPLCAKCRVEERDALLNAKARNKKYWMQVCESNRIAKEKKE